MLMIASVHSSDIESSEQSFPFEDHICEAFGCTFEASEYVQVNAYDFGYISLQVCNYCKKIFLDEEKNVT